MATDDKNEREQYLKELARLKSLRNQHRTEKKDAVEDAASLPVHRETAKRPDRETEREIGESVTEDAESASEKPQFSAEEQEKRRLRRVLENMRRQEAASRRQAEQQSAEAQEAAEEDVEEAPEEIPAGRFAEREGLREARDEEEEMAGKTARRPRRQAKESKAATVKRKKRNPLLVLIGLLCTFLVVWGAKTLLLGQKTHETGFYTVAVFGVDSRNGNLGKGALSDVNMLVSLNKETGDIRICSIFRDTFVQIDKKGKHHKFNEAYFQGGPEQSLWMMRYNLDIQPDDYVTFNWKAVVDAVNIMGGVDLEVTPAEFKYINSFITETVKSTGVGSVQLTHAGMNHLDGVQAVAYARLRLMDSDYNRTERQRKVVSLLMDKIHAADAAKRIELVTSVLPETKTSMGIDDVLAYAKDIKKYHIAESSGFPFERDTAWVEKKDCVVPITLESNVVSLHQFLYQQEDYQPSASVKEVSAYIVKRTGMKGKGEKVDIQTDKPGAVGNTGPVKEKTKKNTEVETAREEKKSNKQSSSAAESAMSETTVTETTAVETTTAAAETESRKKRRTESTTATAAETVESHSGRVQPNGGKNNSNDSENSEAERGPGSGVQENKHSATSSAETELVGPGAGLPAN